MRILDQIAAPGVKLDASPDAARRAGGGRRGDDRFGYDASAGRAWVIDGATDVGDVRLFPHAESDAAWYAETLSRAFIDAPPKDGEASERYLGRVVAAVVDRARADCRFDLDEVPRASLPTAAALWLRRVDAGIEAASLGDCLALVQPVSGDLVVLGDAGKADEETERVREVVSRPPAERRKWLQATRALHNTETGYWVFGLQPEAVARCRIERVAAPAGTRVLMMTDGFYRLVSPFRLYTHEALIARAAEAGLGVLLDELRRKEAAAADDPSFGRFKASDDATALLIEM
ncbi:hypothetical protein GC169_04140 [bacterium]|nr:hypothetical protein [bacterium]